MPPVDSRASLFGQPRARRAGQSAAASWGLWAALMAARAGLSVVVADRDHIGAGASGGLLGRAACRICRTAGTPRSSSSSRRWSPWRTRFRCWRHRPGFPPATVAAAGWIPLAGRPSSRRGAARILRRCGDRVDLRGQELLLRCPGHAALVGVAGCGDCRNWRCLRSPCRPCLTAQTFWRCSARRSMTRLRVLVLTGADVLTIDPLERVHAYRGDGDNRLRPCHHFGRRGQLQIPSRPQSLWKANRSASPSRDRRHCSRRISTRRCRSSSTAEPMSCHTRRILRGRQHQRGELRRRSLYRRLAGRGCREGVYPGTGSSPRHADRALGGFAAEGDQRAEPDGRGASGLRRGEPADRRLQDKLRGGARTGACSRHAGLGGSLGLPPNHSMGRSASGGCAATLIRTVTSSKAARRSNHG